MISKPIDSKDRHSLTLVQTNSVTHLVLDAIRMGAGAIRDAVEWVYPAAQWLIAPGMVGGPIAYGPPFTFLTGSIYKLPDWHPPASAPAASSTPTPTR